jgi:PKD repeat protein
VPSHAGAEDTATHVSPSVTAAAGDWVLTYYVDQGSGTTAWTPPAGVVVRDSATQTGSGRYGALAVDSGGPVDAGSYGGLTARTNAVSSHAVAWTVALAPPPDGPPGNQPPTARFSSTVSGLTASFDGTGSSDSDGSVVSYDWSFGDGDTATGAQPQHTYGTGGSRQVTLTVTDDAGAVGSVTHTVTVSGGSTGGPCGTLPYDAAHPPSYDHVVVIMDENRLPSELTPTTAPYLTGLATQCGSEGFMHAATHASDPNYMAATGGMPTPMGTMRAQDNIFHQAQVAGDTWKSYQETMNGNCGVNKTPYSSYHDPAHWYSDLRSPVNTCTKYDVPLAPALANDLANDALPTYSWVTPDDCDNMHWKSYCTESESQAIHTGDQWLKQVVGEITATPSYQAGRTLVILTWDEGSGHAVTGSDCSLPSVYSKQPSCSIPTYVVSPYIVPGARDTSDHNLYGLLATIQDILGYPRLARAVGQTSLRTGLGF